LGQINQDFWGDGATQTNFGLRGAG